VCFEFQNLYYVEGDAGETLRRIVRVWDGGLAIYGGVIASVLTVLVVSRVKKISFPAFADLGCMGLLIGQCIGRWGNFVNVEAFGSVTGVPWRMAGPNVASYLLNNGLVDADVYEQIVDGALGVHPTFFYESLWNLAGFLLIALVVARRRSFDGQVFLSYVAWYGIGRFWIEGLRTDSLYVFGTLLRVSQLLAGVSALAAIGLIAFGLWYGKKHGPRPLYVEQVREKENEKEKNDHGSEDP
jgi:phosphatidylglycerol:prolipoprotein diacylglycerol transferase